MTRDDDLIRALMLALEQANSYVNDNLVVEGYTRDQVAYHLGLIVRAGYAEGPQPRYSSSGSDPTIPLSVVVIACSCSDPSSPPCAGRRLAI